MVPGGKDEPGSVGMESQALRGMGRRTQFRVVKCLIRVLPPLKPEFVGQRGKTGERRCANKRSSCACRDTDPNTCRVPQCLLSQSCGDMLTSSFKESGA